MPAQPVPLEVMLARSTNGKTLGGRELEVIDVSAMDTLEVPPAPDGLKERGTVEWTKIWLAGKWLWPDQDYVWVEQAARAYDDLDAFRAEIAVEGLMIDGQRGTRVANPLIAEVRKAEETIRKCLSQIGFSPTDRARLKLTELKSEKTAQDILNNAPSDSSPKVVASYVEGEW